MGLNTLRYTPHEPQPQPSAADYWRRRFLALAAGLAVLSAIAWAFSGALAVSRTSSRPAPAAASRTRHAVGPGRAAAVGPGASTGGDAGTAARYGGLGGSGWPAWSDASAPRPAVQSAALRSPQACSPAQVVLSVFPSQPSYRPGQLPKFDVDVVSTSPGTCVFNVGPRFLALVVTAAGNQLWSSADCARGPGTLVTDLARGVPMIVPVSWNRQTSAPGCPASTRRIHVGSFAATASDGSLTSDPATFRMR
jgi:hypothetical protein